ncbi:MAG: alpha/beta fold hydrolase, partial [Gemmatimonadaceae bacterium]
DRMSMATAALPRRDDPDTWYPAGVAGVVARWLTLPDGERVRVVEMDSAPGVPASTDVLLLHGWGCNAFHFRRLLPALAQRGVRGIALDLRGHGLSHKPSELAAYTSSAVADFAQRVLDALGLEQAGLVGHSLGGAVALDVALNFPSRVRWLALLNPVGVARMPYAPLLAQFPGRYAERVPAAVSRVVGWAALHLAYGGLARPDPGDLEQYLYPTLTPGGRFGMMAYARAFSWEPRTADALERIACPMHVLFGERDRVVRRGEAMERLRVVRHLRTDVIARAGHVLAEEAADRVAEAVAALSHAPVLSKAGSRSPIA